ncbi:hypothetical protein B0H13DRAFT_1970910 [Mycena leptocephala]|nr:hypothetical protein B0H13DRAFT_1970910 [Mycena leptocephala]
MTAQPRTFKTATSAALYPVMLGRKSASWFLVYDRPRGMSMWREYMPLNTLYTKDPFPKDSPEGHPKFWLESPLDGGMLDFLVGDDRDGAGRGPVAKKTGRKSGEAVEVEVLLDDREIAYACAAGMCGKWEVPGMPAFERCSGCKTRRYCSTECQRADWKARHKRCCTLLKEGNFREAEALEQTHRDQQDWHFDKMTGAIVENVRSSEEPGYWEDTDFQTYGARGTRRPGPFQPTPGDEIREFKARTGIREPEIEDDEEVARD